MRLSILSLLICATVLTACSTTSSELVLPENVEWVSYESSPGPFCGKCETTKIIAAYDHRVWIERGYWAGDYEDWRISRTEPKASQKNLISFRNHLAQFRPNENRIIGIESPLCDDFFSDSNSLRITWHDKKGSVYLIYDFGCQGEDAHTLADALKAAPSLLNIDSLNN